MKKNLFFIFLFSMIVFATAQGASSLRYAVVDGDLQRVIELLDNGADLYEKDNFESTLLHESARVGCIEITQLLIEKGLDINVQDRARSTPLHTAIFYGNLQVVEFLLKQGANIKLCDSFGRDPWLLAIIYQREKGKRYDDDRYKKMIELLEEYKKIEVK